MTLPPQHRKRDPPGLVRARRRVLERRRRVADLRLKGISQKEIARTLGVDPATICHDFAALDEDWREQAAQVVAIQKGLDLQRIEHAIGSIWDKVLAGNPNAIRTLADLLGRKAKLLGLDAPTNINIDWRTEVRNIGLDPDQFFESLVQIIMSQRGPYRRDGLEGPLEDPGGPKTEEQKYLNPHSLSERNQTGESQNLHL